MSTAHQAPGSMASRFSLRENRFLRFLAAGGVNTVFGFAAYSVAVVAGAPNWLALLTGTLTGLVFNFFTTGGYAFRQLSAARFPGFAACYFAVYGVNLGLLGALSPVVDSRIVAQLLLSLPVALFSYVLLSRLVFAGAGTGADRARSR